MNMQNIMAQAQRMQKEIMEKKDAINKKEFDGKSEWAEIKLNGKKEVLSITIKKDVKYNEEDDINALEDMLKIAFNDALKQIDAENKKELGAYSDSLSGLI